MLNRYQTGPCITLLVFVVALGLCAFDLVDALHFRQRNGWINAAVTLSLLFFFDRYFKRGVE